MTSRYRTVGYGSNNVDESLFGDRASDKVRLKSAKKSREEPVSSQPVVISRSELARIKNEAVIKSEAELEAEKQREAELKKEREKIARERKTKMKELEKISNSKARLTDEEVQRQARDQAIRDAAVEKRYEQSDVVKTLRSMSARAVAFTMRERQIEELKHREGTERDYDRAMDMSMEVDRLKDLQRRQEEEQTKREKRIESRKVIIEQMDARQREKYLEAEMREQENVAMRNMMKKYEEEDQAASIRRQKEIEQARVEVKRANDIAIRRKEEAKEQEKKEIEDILIYQAQKDAELAKREEEERILERAKKERQAKLLDQQEKAQSNADKLDELRARRAMEERERRERQKEKEEALQRKAEMEELLASRRAQALDKKQRAEAAKERQKEEHVHALQYITTMAARESEEKAKKQEAAFRHRNQILDQIKDIEKTRKETRSSKMSEGTNMRQNFLREEAKYSVIRDQMVTDLESAGVDPRFLSEMKNVDIGKILKR